MIRRRPWLMAGIVVLVLAGASLALAPRVMLRMKANEARYLVNDHDYLNAWAAFEALRRRAPGATETLLPDFESDLMDHARSYFNTASEARPADYLELLGRLESASHQSAPQARTLRLDYLSRRDGATSATLAAARDILEHEGYQPDALWWLVQGLYDPARPLELPAELVRYAEPLERPYAADQRPDEQAQARKLYLRALLRLHERDWAGAALRFEQLQSRGEEVATAALARGIALQRAGRNESAAAMFREATRLESTRIPALLGLTQAFLETGNPAGAAQATRMLMHEHPAGRDALLGRLAPEGEGPAFARLARSLAPGRSQAGDWTLWHWLRWCATGDRELGQIAEIGRGLAARLPQDPQGLAMLLSAALTLGDEPMLAALRKATYPPGHELAPQAAAGRRLMAWHRDPATTDSAPLATAAINRLLTRDETIEVVLDAPAGATLVVVMAQGYMARGTHPAVHLAMARRSVHYYAMQPRSRFQPLVILLTGPLEAARSLPVEISLITGGTEDLQERNVLIGDVTIF